MNRLGIPGGRVLTADNNHSAQVGNERPRTAIVGLRSIVLPPYAPDAAAELGAGAERRISPRLPSPVEPVHAGHDAGDTCAVCGKDRQVATVLAPTRLLVFRRPYGNAGGGLGPSEKAKAVSSLVPVLLYARCA